MRCMESAEAAAEPPPPPLPPPAGAPGPGAAAAILSLRRRGPHRREAQPGLPAALPERSHPLGSAW